MTQTNSKILCLDRDGILNELIINTETKFIDSPQTLEEIKVYPWAPKILKQFQDWGYSLAICTNQPNAAKGNNTKEKLQEIHNHIIDVLQSEGAIIRSSNICFHKKEDDCKCRKPKTGMLEVAFSSGVYDKKISWMIGDMWSDCVAGHSFGLNTALLSKLDLHKQMEILKEQNISPTFNSIDLRDFANFLRSFSHYL